MNQDIKCSLTADTESLEVAKPVVDFFQAKQLVEKYGSPLLVYSKSAIRENYWVLKNAMPKVDLFYAVKSNYEDAILQTLLEEGGYMDICSSGELKKTMEIGFSVDQMIHTHPCKSQENLETCYDAGVRWFVYDCSSELKKMLAYKKDYNLLLRLKASGESSLINLSAKFGCELEKAAALVDETIAMGGTIKGLSFHVGSQCLNPADYGKMLKEARKVWDYCVSKGCDMQTIDIGGGFPAPYRDAIISLHDFASQVYAHLEEVFGDTGARYVAEPGRGLSARSATLITKILGKNERSGETWYFLDDGIYGCFSGKVFDHMDYELLHEKKDVLPLETCIIAGPTCDSSDVVSRHDHPLPEMEIGDLILVPTMGSYTRVTAAALFNGLEPAKVLVIE